ncbi:glycosyltransferase family 1 protein [Lachnospiraceae bacterium 62-35]
MKILIDLTALADNFSGIERYAACLTRELLRYNENEYILIFKNEVHPIFKDCENRKSIEIAVISSCKKLFFNQIKLPFEIYKYTADWYLFMAFPVPILLFRKNMVSTIHDICCWDCPETMNGMSKWYFRISHRAAMIKCKSIITISKFSKARIVARLNYPKEKIWLIYCGVDKKFLNYVPNQERSKRVREQYNLPEQYILSVSTLEPRKNLRLLISSYQKLILNGGIDIPLVLAGRKGWKVDGLLNDIDDKVKDRILFTGFINDVDLPVIYGNAKLFVFPSMYEGFGIPPLEAMACGTRVLSSNTCSLPEVLGETAEYFENNDEEDLCVKINKCLKNNSDRTFKFKQNKFLWSYEAEKLINFMREI